jgi:hypothetical protein
MLDSTLTPYRATSTLLLMHQSLYKWKPTKWCVLQNGMKGGIYRVLGSVSPPWKKQLCRGWRPGGHHVASRHCLVEKPSQVLQIIPCHLLDIVATKSRAGGHQSRVRWPPFWAHLAGARSVDTRGDTLFDKFPLWSFEKFHITFWVPEIK